jgi:hypothetical protein
MIRRLAEKLWSASRKEPRIARTFVLLRGGELGVRLRVRILNSIPNNATD